MENNLTEMALADAVAELSRMRGAQPFILKPTEFILGPDDIQRIADCHGFTYEEVFALIKARNREVDDE